jgi:hypothetical protein
MPPYTTGQLIHLSRRCHFHRPFQPRTCGRVDGFTGQESLYEVLRCSRLTHEWAYSEECRSENEPRIGCACSRRAFLLTPHAVLTDRSERPSALDGDGVSFLKIESFVTSS